MNKIIANKYKLLEILGQGAFGNIYKAVNIRTGGTVALKIEPIDSKTKMLKNETKIYQYLNNIECVPRVLWFGVDETNYYMALTLLGPSLKTLKDSSLGGGPTFSLETVFSITIKMVKILECIHKKGLLHRDVKPDNFLMGTDHKSNLLYLIDFGFCRKYLLEDNTTHIPFRDGRKIIGTPNFISIHMHDGYEPSRRDDLESVVYIMIYLLTDKLSWANYSLHEDYRNMNNKIRMEKMRVLTDEKTPKSIREFFNYCRSLKYDEEPNYEIIYSFLKL